MLRRGHIERVARPKRKKMTRIPFMPSRAVLKDKEEIDAVIRVILPPYGEVITIDSTAVFRCTYHPGAHIELGLEDLLKAIMNYRTVKPLLFPPVCINARTTKQLHAELGVMKKEVEKDLKIFADAPLMTKKKKYDEPSPPPKPAQSKRLGMVPVDKKKEKKVVSTAGDDRASAIRNALRNKPTVRKKKIVTTREETVIVRPVAEPVVRKMSLAEMGVEFGTDIGNVPQRYDEIQEKLAKLKGTP